VYATKKLALNAPLIEDEDQLFNRPSLQRFTNWAAAPSAFASDLSICEDQEKNAIIVEAALPGVNKEDVDITFEKGVLTIRASTREKEEDKKRKYFRKRNSSFMYRMTVPGNIDESQEPKANLSNGVMYVEFKKKT